MSRIGAFAVALLMVAEGSCHSRDNPLADLPKAIAPLVDRSKCEPVPAATAVTLPVKGPFTLCTGAFPSRERFGLMRDTSGRTVWFARSWRATPQAVALARFDSLTSAMESRYGPATTCGHVRRVWKVQEFVFELSLESVSDAVYGSELGIPWLVHFNGQVGQPPSCPGSS